MADLAWRLNNAVFFDSDHVLWRILIKVVIISSKKTCLRWEIKNRVDRVQQDYAAPDPKLRHHRRFGIVTSLLQASI